METYIIEDAKVKKRMKMICFTPAIPFFISLVYYLFLLFPLTHGNPEPKSAVGITSANYNTLFMLLAFSAIVAAMVLIYCIVHLVRIKTLNSGMKMIWAILLVTFVPVSFILFWHFQIKNEPVNLPVYKDID